MNISVERLPECKARLSAAIPAETVNKTRREIVSAYTTQAKVPGFRPGKIPVAVIEKRFAGPIEDELKDRLARSAYAEARTKEDLIILGIAEVEREVFEADGSYMLAVEVVTEPEIEIGNYKGIPVEITKMEVTDEMINGYLDNTRKQQAVPKDSDKAAGPGDLAVISYVATLEGEPLADKLESEAGPLASGDDHWVDLPEEGAEPREFIPGLAAAVVGLSAGETKSFDATYAEDFPIPAVAGKTVSYEVTVKQVKERQLPELNDDFAKAIGAESVEVLRERVRSQFEMQRERMRSQIIDNQILGHLNQDATFDLPQHIVFNETQRQVNQMVSRGYEQGMTESDIQENQEDLLKNAETQAKNNVKTMFILDEIAKAEGITVDDNEMSQRVAMIAYQQRRPIKKVARELRDRNAFGEIRQDILISKTIEFLRANATVTEVDPPETSE
jgi:trigger factor